MPGSQPLRRGLLGRATLTAMVGAAVLTASTSAMARSFVVLHDDGTLAKPSKVGVDAITNKVVSLYDETGAPRPDVISVWTTFSMDGSSVETLFDPMENDVTGIGLGPIYGGDGLFKSSDPPIKAILLHNDVTKLADRAAVQGAPLDGFAQYLFLLELSHMWGPALAVPAEKTGGASDAGAPDTGVGDGGSPTDAGVSNELVGFPFHWSFWMSAGGSPAGGNDWKDNGDGTYSVSGQSPAKITYSMLDLYVMGLASSNEVPPFGVIEDPIPPAGLKDPFTGGPYSATSFPWFGTTSFTAKGKERKLTIEDVISANGMRSPDEKTSPKSWKLAVALVFDPSYPASDMAQAEAAFEPIAASLAPAFHRATRGRGTMELVSVTADDAGARHDGGSPRDAGRDAEPTADSGVGAGANSSGCAVGLPGDVAGAGFAGLGAIGIAAVLRRRRRSA